MIAHATGAGVVAVRAGEQQPGQRAPNGQPRQRQAKFCSHAHPCRAQQRQQEEQQQQKQSAEAVSTSCRRHNSFSLDAAAAAAGWMTRARAWPCKMPADLALHILGRAALKEQLLLCRLNGGDLRCTSMCRKWLWHACSRRPSLAGQKPRGRRGERVRPGGRTSPPQLGTRTHISSLPSRRFARLGAARPRTSASLGRRSGVAGCLAGGTSLVQHQCSVSAAPVLTRTGTGGLPVYVKRNISAVPHSSQRQRTTPVQYLCCAGACTRAVQQSTSTVPVQLAVLCQCCIGAVPARATSIRLPHIPGRPFRSELRRAPAPDFAPLRSRATPAGRPGVLAPRPFPTVAPPLASAHGRERVRNDDARRWDLTDLHMFDPPMAVLV